MYLLVLLRSTNANVTELLQNVLQILSMLIRRHEEQNERQSERYFNQFVKIQTSGQELTKITAEIVNLFSKHHNYS